MECPKVAFVLNELRRLYPDAKTTLDWSNPLELLVATILSAQCTDARVNMTTPLLFKKYKRPEDYLKVPVSELQRDIRSCGAYRAKALAICESCRTILEKYGGEVPQTMKEMLMLRGVGRKTASVVLSTAYKVMEGIAVDTHVRRVSMRLGLAWHDDPKKIEIYLMEKTPKKNWGDISNLLIAHGRKTCIARTPRCAGCVFKFVCPSSRVLFPGCKR
ncbi:endonuclease III [Candidatus Peribacteria bacterium RIFCSPLOWO2_01_FULL_51_18]|nr:MAG: endonuclease III [Candidatus Peribacteria bacterium RIFCSPHIGHO2_02_FULL_51_15]OGJ65138.1 MAG: endonuclease III [Candidatus Peribacteria bacterium RIFCSPLOWO2_01_FULL_51_18]